MKIFKYTFVFFLLTLNLRLYSANNINSVVINNFYNITNDNYPGNPNGIHFDEDNYKQNDPDFWKKEASKTDDTYSFWYWLSNVSVLSTGLCCILSYFLFPEWFLLLATIFGLLYILNFFVQIISPTAQCLFNLKSREDFRESVRDRKLVVRSSITIEHEKSVKKEGGSEEKLEVEKPQVINGECKIPVTLSGNVVVKKLRDDSLNMNLYKSLINLNIELNDKLKGEVGTFLNNQIKTARIDFRCPIECNGKHKIKRNVSWRVLGVENYMLIAKNMSDKPWHVGFLWFSLFTILPFSQFYKLWVNRYCDVEELSITYTSRQYNI